MDHLYLLAPWILVAGIVAYLLDRHRRDVRTHDVAMQAAIVVGAYGLYYVVRGITPRTIRRKLIAAVVRLGGIVLMVYAPRA